jgi:hypothetical protein
MTNIGKTIGHKADTRSNGRIDEKRSYDDEIQENLNEWYKDTRNDQESTKNG